MEQSTHVSSEIYCTTEDLIKAIPDWVQVGNLVLIDPFEINDHFSETFDAGDYETIGLIIEYYVLDIDSIEGLTAEGLEELFHYGEWLACILLVKGVIIETDISSISKI